MLACCLLALAWSAAPLSTGGCVVGALGGATRCIAPRAALTPYRSDDRFDYFRVEREMQFSLPKPLGAVLEECEPAGVRVEELQEGGSAFDVLRKGDRLLSVVGNDVASSDFDTVMSMLVEAPDEVELKIVRTSISRKPREAKPPLSLTVDGKVVGEAACGTNLRTAVQGAGATLYKGLMAKASQCGGVGQCSLCWVDVVEGAENLSPRTALEESRGRKKPPTYRMACQTVANGDVSVVVPAR